ncbi:MAG: type II secretion system protein GspC [Proteobacteria bacterium]|nr:type II secretion system protein GspC [Pseudomonadota bacterium]
MNATAWIEGLPTPDRWRGLLLRDGPRYASWLLVIALGIQAALLVTDLAGVSRGVPVPGARAATVARHPVDVAAIANAHLFGVAPVPQQDAANAPQTSMPLVLTGVIAGRSPENGLAIIGASAQTAEVRAVGDTLPGGARLHSVYADRVVIDRGGQLETLALPRPESGGMSAPPPMAVLPQNPSLERMRRMIAEQPNLIGDVLRPQPVMEHGKLNGFRVYPGRERASFARLGLKPGDQVIAINGTPLDDRDRSDEILHTLSSASEARVTVLRDGQRQDLNLNIAQVAQEAESLATAPGMNGTAPATPEAATRGVIQQQLLATPPGPDLSVDPGGP